SAEFLKFLSENSRASAAKEWETTGQGLFIALLENLLDKVRKGEDFQKELESLYNSQVFQSWRANRPKPKGGRSGWGNV
ncbi:MAG: hypothetical protein O2871_02330, partial [bacterium]|nr:hypothetical protein [bacterium]